MYDARHRDDCDRARYASAKQAGRTSAPVLHYDVQANSWTDEDARTRRQPRTGLCHNSRSNDYQILPGKPRYIQWIATILLALCMCGIVPIAIAEGVFWITDALNCQWLIVVMCAAAVLLIWRWIERDL